MENKSRSAIDELGWTFSWPGTLISFIYGVSMPGDCPASLRLLCCFSVENIPLQAERHSGRTTKTVRLPPGIGVHLQTGMLFGITTEWCSASDRNRVHLRQDSPSASANYQAVDCLGSTMRIRNTAVSDNRKRASSSATQTPGSGLAFLLRRPSSRSSR